MGVTKRATASRKAWQPTPITSHGTVSEVIADQIRIAIIGGDLPANSRLPGESDLARQFNVSRGTVREALQQLASQSLIVTKRGVQGGSFVTHPTPAHIERTLGTSLAILAGSDAATVEWMIESRELLEVPAAGLAATRHHAADLEAIESTLHSAEKAGGEAAETQHDFHIAVVRATGNSMLEIMLRPLFDVLNSKLGSFTLTTNFAADIDKDHRRIANAIRARDPERAQQAMVKHLTRLRKEYESIWEINGG